MKFFPLLFVLALLVGSCNLNMVYRPVTVKPNLFQGKGDMEAGINVSELTEIHGAYAVHDNWAVGAAYSGGKYISDTLNWDTGINMGSPRAVTNYRMRDFEFSGTFFRPLGDKSIVEVKFGLALTKNLVEEIWIANKNSKTLPSFSPYTRYFLQPTIGFHGEFADFGFVTRMQLIRYQADKKGDYLFEPTLFTRLGYKYVKAMFQFGIVLPSHRLYNSNGFNGFKYNYPPVNLGMGLYFQLSGKDWKK